MKKLAALALAVLCLLALGGCGGKTGAISDALVEEDGMLYLILPISGEKVPVREDDRQYLENLDTALLKSAEEALLGKLSGTGEKSGFYLEKDGVQLYLCLEVIVPIDPPETVTLEDGSTISSGCGVDHDHVFYTERITG